MKIVADEGIERPIVVRLRVDHVTPHGTEKEHVEDSH